MILSALGLAGPSQPPASISVNIPVDLPTGHKEPSKPAPEPDDDDSSDATSGGIGNNDVPEDIEKQGWSKRLEDCHPKIRETFPKVRGDFCGMHSDCTLKVDYTWRSKAFQFELYKKGRSLIDGKWVVSDKSQVVTDKDGSSPSHHQTYPAQAVDIYIERAGKIIWEDTELYTDLGNLWDKYGLISGATWVYKWHDPPHVQVAYKILA